MLVVETAVRNSNAAPVDVGAGIETDPLALWLAMEVHSQVGVDEQELPPRQCRRDTVAEIGSRNRALQWRGRLARDHRGGEAHPHCCGTLLDERATRVAHLDAGAVKGGIVTLRGVRNGF